MNLNYVELIIIRKWSSIHWFIEYFWKIV